ncbi:MAG: hypothetical protein HOV79_25835 [Hamadaea sp.]|nr:hypothetical protein [Hamadaea sp.]
MSADRIAAAVQRITAAGFSPPRPARDPVNAPMIRNWTEALGDDNPLYADHDLAPPAMAQVWTMRGLRPAPDPDDPLTAISAALDDSGYTSVVATDSDQTYDRYLRHGEHVAVRTRLVDVTGPKRTRLGEGFFATTESVWTVDGEQVARMTFRILKFRPDRISGGSRERSPATSPVTAPAPRIRPVVTADTAFFWAGAAAGELRIQRCTGCGALRHPPGPACPACGADKPDHVVATGRGEVFSYVVHHHPAIPGRRLPVVVALVALPEGVRVLGELLDVDPERVRIGMPVRIAWDHGARQHSDDDLALPAWRPAELRDLPPLRLPVTPTFVIASALATRDFQDVHHDRDLAVQRGGKDIFVNILTTTGLVQRYVTDWAGPGSRIRRIAIRLGMPCHPGDELAFSGHHRPDTDEIAVTGRVAAGAHVTGTVEVELP